MYYLEHSRKELFLSQIWRFTLRIFLWMILESYFRLWQARFKFEFPRVKLPTANVRYKSRGNPFWYEFARDSSYRKFKSASRIYCFQRDNKSFHIWKTARFIFITTSALSLLLLIELLFTKSVLFVYHRLWDILRKLKNVSTQLMITV